MAITDPRPRVFLTNSASLRSKGHAGTGARLSIMAWPRQFERGDGFVRTLRPKTREELAALTLLLRERAAGAVDPVTVERLRTWLVGRWTVALNRGELAPGRLFAEVRPDHRVVAVRDGDTLFCACARGAPCHRVWAAELLLHAGWDVTLDGREVRPDEDVVR